MNQGKRELQSRMMTATQQTADRPMTSYKAAGFSKNLGKDPREIEMKTKILFSKRPPSTKEQIVKEVEKSIQKLYDDSILLKHKGEYTQGKEKCLLALEKLTDMKKKNVEYFNTELEFGIRLNLALIYEALHLWDEAKQSYTDILQQDYYSPGVQYQRIRVNLGNVFYQQGDYKKALTEWKKAVDKISKDNKELRASILKNIANAHIKMGNYTDAIDNYSESMKLNPDVKTTMNLLLCDLAVEKVEQTKNVFKIMLDVSAYGEKEIDTTDDNSKQIDPLKEYFIMKKKENANIIVNVALVMIHYIDKDPLKSFDYIIEAIKRAGSKEILNEIEMAKAMYFLKKRDVEKTIQILKSFENKNKKLISRVANNISFLYFVEGDANNAEKYANIALDNERYNHKALVNKGNIHFLKEDYLKSKEFYLEAIGVQSDCIEAIYNLGMVNIRMEAYYEAIQAFEKLNSVVPNIPEVLYKIARLYEYMKQFEEAIKYYSILLLHIPNDPILLSSLGSLYYQINPKDERTYMHYFEDSFRYFPSNFDNLIVLGFLYFKEEVYEKALQFFELAVKVQPNAYTAEIQYAKCFYKLGDYKQAYKAFKKIHNKYPENREGLTFLIAACKDLGLSYDEYHQKLLKIEREQITMSNPEYEYYNQQNNYEHSPTQFIQQEIKKDYKGEEVDFSKYSNKNSTKNNNNTTKPVDKFIQFEHKPEELLP